jgi:hypothetical protein
LILPVALSAWCLRRIGRDDSFWFLFLFLFFGAWFIGLLIGVGLTVVVKRPRMEPYFYLSGQLLMVLVFVGFFIFQKFSAWNHERDFGIVDDNHSLVDIGRPVSAEWTPGYIRTAFIKLESTFADPNSFVLTQYRSTWRDTLVGSTPDTVFTVYFTYLKKKEAFFAKVTVLGDSTTIDSMDMRKSPRKEYESSKHFGVYGRSATAEELNEQYRKIPDSIRKKMAAQENN